MRGRIAPAPGEQPPGAPWSWAVTGGDIQLPTQGNPAVPAGAGRGCAGYRRYGQLSKGRAGAPALSSVPEGFESHGQPVASIAVRRGSRGEGQRCVIPWEQPRRCGCRDVPAPPAEAPAALITSPAPAIKSRRRSVPTSQLPETRISKERATHGRRDVLFGDPDRAE